MFGGNTPLRSEAQKSRPWPTPEFGEILLEKIDIF
jgi:hypothetical protein